MPRRLEVIHRLLREPCPVDPSTLPRTAGGFDCAKCGRTVVDVASLTLEEAVEFRRRSRAGGERICGAYTVDRDERVLVRASPSSSALVAVAVSALLAACESPAPSGTGNAGAGPPATATARVSAFVAEVEPPPVAAPAPHGSVETPASSAEPPCKTQRISTTAHSSRQRSQQRGKDLQVLAGY